MPLTERTERALEACHDAILAPTRWPSALQSLAESFGAASCMFYEHDRENSPAPAPMSEGHVAFADRLTRNQAHAPDPHVGPYLQKCNSFRRAGWASVLEHDLSTEDERRTIPFYPGDGATGEAGVVCGVLFLGRRPQLVLADLPRRRPVYARTRETPCQGRTLSRQNRQSGPEVCRVRRSPRNSRRWSESSSAAIVIDATGRARQMNAPAQDLLGDDFNLVQGRPAARDPASNRRLQQLVSFALHAERGSAQAFAPIVVDRDEAPWLLVEAMPVTAFGSDFFSSGRVILLLTDLRSPLRPEATQFCAAFGLTVAEAKLAAKLASA